MSSHTPVIKKNMLRTFFSNAVSLLTSDVLNKATTFGIYAMVSRGAGSHGFGQLSLSLLLFYTFQVLATAGLPTLITRETAKHPGRTRLYLLNGCAAALATSACAMFGMMALAFIMQYEADTVAMICTLSLGLLPFGLALVIESVFRGREKMYMIAIANVPANLMKVGGAWALLANGFSIIYVAWLLVGVRVAILVIEWAGLMLCIGPSRGRLHFRLVKALVAKSSTFFGIDGISAVWSSVNAMLLSKFATEAEVGLYGAATQLMQPALMIYRSIVGSVFPAMCSRAAGNLEELARMTRWLVTFLLLLGAPAAVLVFTFADVGLLTLYGKKEFLQATDVLRVLSSVLLLQCVTNVLGHALWAATKESTALRIVAVNLVLNILIGFGLVYAFDRIDPEHGALMGTAYAAMVVALINTAQHYLACRNTLQSSPIDLTLLKPLAAAVLMIGCMLLLSQVTNRYMAAAVGCGVYVLAVLGFIIWSHGGVRGVRDGYFAPLLNSR